MSAVQKRILGSVLSAAVTAGIAFLDPAYRVAALGLFTTIMAALHIPRPGDANEADTQQEAVIATVSALRGQRS